LPRKEAAPAPRKAAAPPRAAATEEARARAKAEPSAAAQPSAAAPAEPSAQDAPPASDRVVAPRHAEALFAQHSWVVLKPAPVPPPAAPPPPPPEPTAPPLPYTFVGSLSRDGHPPVYFLASGDRVIDAHVGDRLDGAYRLESAAGGELVFVYLPLNIRQSLAAGVAK
jgi:hypothetical protein